MTFAIPPFLQHFIVSNFCLVILVLTLLWISTVWKCILWYHKNSWTKERKRTVWKKSRFSWKIRWCSFTSLGLTSFFTFYDKDMFTGILNGSMMVIFQFPGVYPSSFFLFSSYYCQPFPRTTWNNSILSVYALHKCQHLGQFLC